MTGVLHPPVILMDPTAVRVIPAIRHALWQPKIDGWRGAVFRDADGVQIQSRSGKLLTQQFPELVAPLLKLPVGTLVDGEVVCWAIDEEGEEVLDFTALRRTPAHRRRLNISVQYYGFDLLCQGGEDIRLLPLSQRWPRLLDLLAGLGEQAPQIQPVPATQDRAQGEQWAAALTHRGFEGLVVKRLSSVYRQAPDSWWKQRYADTMDATVVDVVGTSVLRLRLEDGREVDTLPLKVAQMRQVADVVADRASGSGPLRVEVRVGVGRHGTVKFVRARGEE